MLFVHLHIVQIYDAAELSVQRYLVKLQSGCLARTCEPNKEQLRVHPETRSTLLRRPNGFISGRRQAKAPETGCRPIPLYGDIGHACRSSPILRELPEPVLSKVRHDLSSLSLSRRVLTWIS